MAEFSLHPQLAADCMVLAELDLSTALLMNDSRYPWLILVPRVPALRDWDELKNADLTLLNAEIKRASAAIRSEFPLTNKLNVAALGNMVPQLHVHVIGRHPEDAAWPKPVWGAHPAIPYEAEAAENLAKRLRVHLREIRS